MEKKREKEKKSSLENFKSGQVEKSKFRDSHGQRAMERRGLKNFTICMKFVNYKNHDALYWKYRILTGLESRSQD
jgi:hypothetical protein